ncbi:methylated-DNA--[protein]-cysteine S-methyltransferase [uncultured Dokdonia sp.]|uniref:methylated-DNA--[protein]-cysteine S-methyltransferase n=1 Tax=uncultured Dokdonia sp. TaxID=575653 RepID=UPI0026092612|nr:methylated-DNA--[protein]-cysteine S-methyltransferase [uncultured Dokdonia sp.]
MHKVYIKSPLGTLEIEGDNQGIVAITFLDQEVTPTATIPEILQEVVKQLDEYFTKKRTVFELKLNPQGTNFQTQVWRTLQTVPFGKTASYLDMAKMLGDSKVIRAAASANGKNPIAVVIPCHRVIGSDGSLTGYAGGLHRKKWLLEHESPVRQGSLFN